MATDTAAPQPAQLRVIRLTPKQADEIDKACGVAHDFPDATPESAQLYVVIVGDGPIHYEPGEDQHDGVDDLEVRGPFTQEEATDYAMRLGRYMVLVVPLNPASTPDAMLTASR